MAVTSWLVTFFYFISLSLTASTGQGHTPRRPEPSESSTAHITRIIRDYPNTQFGPTNRYMERTNFVTYSYTLNKNYGTGNILYTYSVGSHADYGSRYYLLRDDLGTTFQYYEPFGTCGKPYSMDDTLAESPGLGFPARWAWLNETKYSGSVKFHKKNVDLWTYTYRNAAFNTSTFHDLGVSKQNPNILRFYFMYTMTDSGPSYSMSVYDTFRNGDPPESVFNVPAICPSAGELGGVSTSDYNGQTPQRPKLAESFSAEITYIRTTFYLNEETLKPAKLYRNYNTKKQLQVNPLGRTTNAGSYYRLLRLDQDQLLYTYLEPFGSCHVTNLSLAQSVDLPGPALDQPMWEWVKTAKFSGVKQFRRQKLNMWSNTVSIKGTNTFYSLGVSRRHPNQPVVLFEITTNNVYMRKVTVFSKYKPGPPQESVFEIPHVCN